MSHTIQIGTGITGNIIETGKPEIVDDILKDSRRVTVPGTPEDDAQRDTMMSAPLILRGKTIGTINAWRLRSSGLFNESELNFLVNIAHQTSISIESIRLFQEHREHGHSIDSGGGVRDDRCSPPVAGGNPYLPGMYAYTEKVACRSIPSSSAEKQEKG
jgi:hypothetical protein